jgi:hypothetical protein
MRCVLLLATVGLLAGGLSRPAAADGHGLGAPAGGLGPAAVAGTLDVAPATDAPDVPETPRTSGSPDRGFYLGALGGVNYLVLEFDDRATLPSRGLTWDPWGAQFELAAGYGFGPGFRAELTLGGGGHRARPDGSTAGVARAGLTGYVPIITHGPVRPHLIGGLSASMDFFHTPGARDLNYAIFGGEGGAGVRAILGRHWSVQADYVHSVLDVALEMVSKPGGDVDQKNVGRRGRMETVRLGVMYDF